MCFSELRTFYALDPDIYTHMRTIEPDLKDIFKWVIQQQGEWVMSSAHPWWRRTRWRRWCRQWWPWHPCSSSGSTPCLCPTRRSGPASCSTAVRAAPGTRWLRRPSARGPWGSTAGPDGQLAPVPPGSDQARPRPECSVPWGDFLNIF